MKKFIVLVIGVLLGAVISYLSFSKVIVLRGGAGMHGFVNAASDAVANKNAVDLITCMKLSKHLGLPVNHFQLNVILNNELQRYDNGTNRAFNILIYVKGYGVGIADSALDKQRLFEQLKCIERFPDVVGVN